jgi:hypothetical protein
MYSSFASATRWRAAVEGEVGDHGHIEDRGVDNHVRPHQQPGDYRYPPESGNDTITPPFARGFCRSAFHSSQRSGDTRSRQAVFVRSVPYVLVFSTPWPISVRGLAGDNTYDLIWP